MKTERKLDQEMYPLVTLELHVIVYRVIWNNASKNITVDRRLKIHPYFSVFTK